MRGPDGGLARDQRRGHEDTARILLGLCREFQGELSRNPSELSRSMVDRAQWDAQVVRIAKVTAPDECDVFRDSQPGLRVASMAPIAVRSL